MKDSLVSVAQRVRVMFIRCHMMAQGSEGTNELCEEPYSDDIYFIATTLNPQFGVQFVKIDVHTDNYDIIEIE